MDCLAFVLQPMCQSTADADKYAFRYKYDSRGRIVEKKVPGADSVTYVYDNDDRLTFTMITASVAKAVSTTATSLQVR